MKLAPVRLHAVLLILALPASAQVLDGDPAVAFDSQPGDSFGAAVAWTLGSEEMLVGAPYSDAGGVDSGRAVRLSKDFVFCLDWKDCTTELLPPDTPSSTGFGSATAVDGDTLLVSAPGTPLLSEDGLPSSALDSTGRGAVHVYERVGSEWQLRTELGRLVADEILAENHAFGWDVALDGDLAVVGGWSQVGPPLESDGPVFVFERSGGTWTHAASLYPSGFAPPFGQFGRTVDIDGETIVVGMPRYSPFDGEQDQGAAFVFERVGGVWTETAKLVAPAPGINHRFGEGVAVDGDLVVIGEPDAPAGGVPRAGLVHRWRRIGGAWVYHDALSAPGPVAFEGIGEAVDLEGERILVAGSPERIVQLGAGPALSIPLPSQFPAFGTGFDAAGDLMVVQTEPNLFEPTVGVAFRFLPGQGWRHVQTLGAQTTSEVGNSYARHVAIEPSTPPRLLVSEPQGDGSGSISGLVERHAWTGSAWSFDGSLLPPDPTSGDRFGAAVGRATFGLLVGAPGDDAAALDAGSVSSYGTVFEQRLLPPPPVETGAAFGSVLSAYEDVLAVGEPGNAGRAHVYRRDGADPWQLEATRLAPEPVTGPGFGTSVAVAGGWLAIGAPEAETASGPDRGAVYLFAEDGGAWTFSQKLEAPGGIGGERFGTSVALAVDFFDPTALRLAVGAPDGSAGGRVHVFETAGGAPWEWMDVVSGLNTAAGDAFGSSVALDTYRLVVGAPESGVGGAAYQFSPCGDGWVQVQEMRPTNPEPGDGFGTSVAWLGDVLVGAPGRDVFTTELVPDTGAAFVFDTQGVVAEGGLTADVTQLSWIAQTPAHLALCGGAASADKLFWFLGSLSGTAPGITLAGAHVPLNVDPLWVLMATHPNQPPIIASPGTLDEHGAANAVFQTPEPTFGPPFTVIDLAYLVIDPAGPTVDLVSVNERLVLNQ